MVLNQNKVNRTMLNLSIKKVPDELVSRLRARAKLHHRSLQGELLTILEEAVHSGRLTLGEVHQRVSTLEVSTGADSAAMLREDRDAR